MNSKRWQDQFSEEFKILEQTYDVTDSSVSMLAYALEKQIISENSYYEWALQNHGTPLLKMSYFGDHPATTQIWEKWQSAYTWSLDCLPISEWDGHLYVACLEPIELPAEMKAIPVLCPLSGLMQLWQKYQSSMSFELKDDAVESTPENSSEELLDMNLQPEEQLEGLVMDAPPISLERTSINGEKLERNIAGPNPLFENAVLAPVTSITEAPPKAKPPVMQSKTISPVMVATDLQDYFLGTVEKGNSQKFIEYCSLLFAKLNEHFPKSLLLGTDHNLTMAKVVVWDEKTNDNQQASPIDLRSASIFRIAESTQKPFHGPVTSNEINQKFFSDWNQKRIPDNVTIIPIIHSNKVIAMVLCAGDSSHHNKASLSFAEKAVQEFNIQIIPGKTKAA